MRQRGGGQTRAPACMCPCTVTFAQQIQCCWELQVAAMAATTAATCFANELAVFRNKRRRLLVCRASNVEEIVVVGAGAAGLTSAYWAAASGARVRRRALLHGFTTCH
jgi:heterodisulfide reductase subunit A-like polyferredoxin